MVLWLALSPEKFPLQADTFGSADLRHYIVGARYPELDTFQNDIIQFGNYLQGEQSTRGGFLLIFWDAPNSYIHASTDNWRGGGLDQGQVLGNKRREQEPCSATQS